jgi:hypothetical protein
VTRNYINFPSAALATASLLVLGLLFAQSAMAQEVEPRRWSHLPVGANFSGVGYAYSNVDIFFSPTLQLENVNGQIHTAVVSYVRGLNVFGKTGRIDVLVPYSVGRWDGLLEGVPASTRRSGFNDPKVRFAVNLIGPPAQRGADFRPFNAGTILGVALEVVAPIGEYNEDKLINLGNNRWTVRPQIGVVHGWNKWAAELTGSVFFYTDNDNFYNDTEREQDPLPALQGHLIYTFRPGLWASLSAAYGAGAESTIDGVEAGDEVGKYLIAASFGYPINRRQGLKLTYLRATTTENTGSDADRVLLAYSVMWGGK